MDIKTLLTPLVGVSFLATGLAIGLISGPASAEIFVYPANGQSDEQQSRDEFECYQWAKDRTGVDPARASAPSTVVVSEPAQGGAGRGLARGGLLGLGVGALAGNAGKGAAIGAATGAVVGGVRRQDQVSRQQQTAQQVAQDQAAASSSDLASYDRAYSVCLEGRGYTTR